jgi:hypothetical protein
VQVEMGRGDRVGGRRRAALWSAAAVPAVSLVSLLSGGTGAGAATAPSSVTATSLVSEALQNAEGGSWVREVGHGTASGHTFSAVNDIGTFEGRQMIDSDKARAEVMQIGQEAYIRGNAAAVSGYFGLTKNDPQQLADTWISLVPSDGGEYTTVIAAVTLKSDFQQQTLSGPLSEGRVVTVDGQPCIPITGQVSAPGNGGTARATLYVTDSKTPLPVEYKAGNKKATSITTWSRWGHAIALTAPPDAIPFASLSG